MAKKSKRDLVAIILAAGKGTRMNSQIPKVLHSVCGTAMIDHVLDALKPLDCSQIYVVTGHLHEQVKEHVGNRAICVLQKERLGTAHAVKVVLPHLKGYEGDVCIICGDTPLIKAETLGALVKRRRSHHTACAVLTTTLADPFGYGRIVRNRDGTVRKIVEEKDTNTYEEKINEINTGFYCFNSEDLFSSLKLINNNNAQKEFYLTDTVEILGDHGKEVEAHNAPDHTEVIGVNKRRDMAKAEKYLRRRILNDIMDSGVTIVDPSTTYIDNTVRIGIDTTIHPFTIIRGNTVIGEGCEVGPNATVKDSRLGNNVILKNAVMEEASCDDDVRVGPYAHVRPGSVVRNGAKIGTFVEIARTDIGENVDIKHLSYLGDAHVGSESYIGAGTMTCNFDGSKIGRTEIGSGVFVGANSLLVAPVRIKDAGQVGHNQTIEGTVEAPSPDSAPTSRAKRDTSESQKKTTTKRAARKSSKKAAKKAAKKSARKASTSRAKK